MTKQLPQEEKQTFITLLKSRFEKNIHRHPNTNWEKIESKLDLHPEKLWSLYQMEETGGEPDVVELLNDSINIVFIDCCFESPKGRRSLCYDQKALDKRKEHKPENSAIEVAKSMGIKILNEEEYRYLQNIEHFDTKTSSWIETPNEIREKGGAVFCDFRYGQVFLYHNGASSYYAARGFRGILFV